VNDDNTEDYYDLYVGALKLDKDFSTIELPTEPLPGEDPEDAMIRWLIEEGIFIPVGDSFKVNEEKAEAFDPNLAKVLRAMIQAEVETQMRELEQQGLIFSSVNKDGEMIYGLTDAGEQYATEIRSFFSE